MNAFMNIQVRVVGTGTALAQFKALAAQARSSAAATNTFGSRLDAHSKTIGRWGNQVQWAGRQLMYNFTLPIALAMGTAAKFALENEKAMTRVVKVYGDGGKQFRTLAKTEIPALAEAFTALSNRFGVHQAQVIGIGADWAAAGASGLALAKSVELTLETMVLGELDAVQATKQLIAIQAQYGFGVEKLSKTVSILNMVENQTGATMKDLMDGMARSAGVARVTGVDVEHLAAMMAALTPAAGSAATAGNALKTILSRILSPTEDAKNVIRAMGIEIDKTAWNALNGVDRLELLAEEFDGLSAAQQAHVATMLGSRWQLNRLIILLQAVRNENSYYNKSLRATASDQALFNQKQYELQKVLESNPQKIQQTWVIIKNAMADVIIPLLPFIVAVATKIAEWAQAFADLDMVTQKWIMTGLVLLALLGPVARYVGALGTMMGLLGGFFGFVITAGSKLLGFFAAPFIKTFQIASKAVGLLLFAFWKLFYGVTVVMPALARLVWAGMQATIAMFGLSGAAIAASWRYTWMVLGAITVTLGGQLRLIIAAVSASLVSIWFGMGRAFVAIWIGVARVLPFLFAATFRSLAVIMLAGARFLLNPWVAAIMAIIGVAYHFRDEIVEAFHGMIQWIVDAFWALPEGMRNALMAVLTMVRDVALQIYEWMSYLNPFARHSPSLVESVTKGMDEIVRQYARASGIGSIFAKAARDLAAFKRTANQNDTTEERKQVVKSGGNVQLFDALRSDVARLQPILAQLEVAVANQERVVDRWAKAVERADQRIENLQNRLDGLQEKLSTLTNAYSEHEQRLQDFASAPLQGMGAMQDAIFANELAQKKLQLQILRTGEASRQAVDAAVAAYEREQDTLDRLQSKLSDINAEIEQHKSALQEFANAPILGMKEMSDAIFENELAQKQLRLEIMKLEDAYGGGQAEDFANTLSKLQQEIDGLQSHISDLRSAGAGSEILGPMQAQLDALVAKRNALANSGSGGGGGDSQLETLRKQLEELQRAGEKLSLEQSLKFDPLTRQIEQLVNAQEEMAFDDIVAGIKREQAAIDALTPAYEEAAAAVRLQEAAVKAAAKARDAAEASYEKERRAVERLEQQLAELQRQAEILQLSYDIKFDPLTREIEKLASAQKELSYDEVVRGIRDEQAAMAALQPRIDRLNAAIATQEERIKRATAARDALQQRYDRENQELQVLQDQYQKTESLIRDIESALRDMGSAAASAIQKAQSAASKTGGAIPESVKTFNAGAGGDWPDPGGKQKIGREFGMGDQSNLIEQFTQDTIDQMNKIFGQVDMFAPLKEWWNRTWQTIKDTVGPHVEAIGGALQRGFSRMGDAIQRSGIIEKVQGVFDRIGQGASWLGDLFAPDWKRLTSGLKKGLTDIWNSIGPELEKFKDIFDPLMKRFRGVGEWLKSSGTLDILKTIGKYIGGGLVLAFKALSGAVTGAIGPLLTMIGDVLGGLIRMLRGILEFIIGVFAGDWEAAWAGIKDVFWGFIEVIVGLGEGLWETLKGIFWGMVDGVREAWEAITGEALAPMSDLSDQVSDIWNDVKEAAMQPLEDLVGWIDKWVVQPIKGLWDWLADELVGHSVIPDMIDDIFGAFKDLLNLPDWIWKNILKPIKDAFVILWEKVKKELHEWWDRITGRVWNRLTKIGDWVWKNVLKPVLDFFHDLWDDIREFAGSWWDRLTNRVWNHLTKIGDWFWKNVFKPIYTFLSDLWQDIREFAGTWWDRLTNNVWNRLTNIGNWFMNNVFKPVRRELGNIWEEIREFASTWWDRLTGNVWNRLTNMGQWFWNNVLKPIKDKFAEAWNGIREWFVNNKDRILNPIQSVVRGIISAINFVIRGINKLSELPGLSFHIGEIGVPSYFAAGGDLPARRANRGFKTNGARAIVGEGKANYPEFVIPTDPTFRSRAQWLLNMAADRVGMYAAPLHASGGVLGVPQYAEGGILGTIRDMANSVGRALTGTVNWIKGNISSLASDLAMGLVQRGRDLLTSNIDWKYGRWAANAAIDQVIDWIRNADTVYEQKARDAQANQKTSMGPDPQAGDWTRMFWRGHQFNVRTVRMIQEAERRLGETFHITQGSYSTSVAQSGTTHAGGGAFDATSPTTFRARDVLRNVGFAAWVRTQLQGDWPRHIHAIAIGDPTVSASAAWQVQDYLAGGNGLAKGGIVRARTGGVIRRLAEAGQDEAVVPLPRGWKTDLLPSKSGTQNGATVIHIHGDLSFPNIDSGDDAKVFIENLKSLAGGA